MLARPCRSALDLGRVPRRQANKCETPAAKADRRLSDGHQERLPARGRGDGWRRRLRAAGSSDQRLVRNLRSAANCATA